MRLPTAGGVAGRGLLVVVVAVFVAAAAPAGFVGEAAAATTTIEFQEALDNQERTSQVTATFTLDANGTVTAQQQIDRGDVVFSFVEWEDLDSGAGGSDSQWQGVAGHRYRVTYEVVAQRSAATDGGNRVSASGFVQGPAGSHGQMSATVYMRSPDFGPVSGGQGTATFESGSSAQTQVTVTVPNDGDGVMRPTDVSFDLPSGFSASVNGLANQIQAGGSDQFTVTVTVDQSVDEGEYTLDGTVHDNLDTGGGGFSMNVEVVKPPVVSVSDVNVGTVLVGRSASTEFTVSEAGGYDDVSDVSATAGGSQFGAIDFDGLGFVEAGGSDTATVTVTAADNAPQGTTLSWRVEFSPDAPEGVSDTATVRARVIYPAAFGSFGFSSREFVFDRPQSQVSRQTTTIEVTVPNTGDLDMNVQSASASGSGPISAEVVSAPNEIPGGGQATFEVRLSAPADAAEGSHGVTLTVDGADRTGAPGSKSVTRQVSVVHTNQLEVSDATLDYGEVRLTERVTASTDVSEFLGYESVNGLAVEKISGPDRWLTVEQRPPSTLGAGAEAPFVVSLRFDTDAELFRQYTWKFRVSGDGVERKVITVTARAKPVNFDAIKQPLGEHAGGSGWQADVASGMVTVFDRLESKLKAGESVSQGDLPAAVAAGKATLLFVNSAEAAQAHLDAGNYTAAQRDVVRAVAAYNIMSFYVERIDGSDLAPPARSALAAARQRSNALVETQTQYLSSELSDANTTVLERAQLNRERARLALLQGNREQAAEYRQQSRAAFETYIRLVEQASAKRQNATRRLERMRQDTMAVVFGQPLMLNPAKWDAFDRQSAAVLSGYRESAETFARAGAVEEAATSRELRREAAAQLQFARYSLYGSTAVYLLAFLGLLAHVARSTYAYVRDAEEAVSGDFLVAG